VGDPRPTTTPETPARWAGQTRTTLELAQPPGGIDDVVRQPWGMQILHILGADQDHLDSGQIRPCPLSRQPAQASPIAFDAVKIRRRKRRTSSSAWPQPTWPSPGPRPQVRSRSRRPTCPSVPSSSFIRSSQAHPAHVSAPFRPGHQPLSGRSCGSLRRRRRSCDSRGSRCLFGYRPSLLQPSCARWGVEPSSRSARPDASPDPIGVVMLPMSKLRPGREPPFIPGTARGLAVGKRQAPAEAYSSVGGAPLELPTRGGHLHEEPLDGGNRQHAGIFAYHGAPRGGASYSTVRSRVTPRGRGWGEQTWV